MINTYQTCSCGTENNPSFKACWKCGASLKDAKLHSREEPHLFESRRTPSEWEEWISNIFGVIAALLFFVFLVGWIANVVFGDATTSEYAKNFLHYLKNPLDIPWMKSLLEATKRIAS